MTLDLEPRHSLRNLGTEHLTDRQLALRDALEPVRAALMEEAAAEADRIITRADAAATVTVEQATNTAQRSVDDAIEQGRRSASAANDQELARTRHEAAARVFEAQRAAHAQLVDATHGAFLALRADARYSALLDRLAEAASARLGPEASIVRDPADLGGVIATHGSRLVDYTLTALADRALDALADQINEVWT